MTRFGYCSTTSHPKSAGSSNRKRSTSRIAIGPPIIVPGAPRTAATNINLSKAAAYLQISSKTLRLAAECGEIDALHPLPDGPWILSHAVLDSTAAKALVHRTRNRAKHPSGPHPDQQNLFSSMA